MKCKNCGSEITGKFCSKCGTDNSVEFQAYTENQKQQTIVENRKNTLHSCSSSAGMNMKWFLFDILMDLPLIAGFIGIFGTLSDSGSTIFTVEVFVWAVVICILLKLGFKFNRLLNMVSTFFSLQTEDQLQELYAHQETKEKAM